MDILCNTMIEIHVLGKWWGDIVIKKRKERKQERKKKRKKGEAMGGYVQQR